MTVIRVGLLGEGIGPSLSPALHMREARHLGLEYRYDIFDLPATSTTDRDLANLLRQLRAEGYVGINVTHPFKQRVLAHLDALSPDAALIGAVNHVMFMSDGRLIGYNTDWTGFRGAVVDGLPEVRGSSVIQVGAGGAGAATAYALLHLGVVALTIVDAVPERAQSLAASYAPLFPAQIVQAASLKVLERLLPAADGVVHATPVGMRMHPGQPFGITPLASSAWLAEVVYRPIETELVSAARAAGHRVLDGGRMAVWQAVDSLRLFSGVEPDPGRMRSHFLELLASETVPSNEVA